MLEFVWFERTYSVKINIKINSRAGGREEVFGQFRVKKFRLGLDNKINKKKAAKILFKQGSEQTLKGGTIVPTSNGHNSII